MKKSMYKALKYSNDIKAIYKCKVMARIKRRIVGKLFGKIMGRIK